MLGCILAVAVLAQNNLPVGTAAGRDIRLDVARELSRGLVEQTGLGESERLARLRETIATSVRSLSASSLVGRALAQASERAGGSADAGVELKQLGDFVRERALDLAFSPRVESNRPSGFPEATPVGEIAMLDYPAYRLARAEMPRGILGGRNGAFWKLFQHIQKHDIPMTAPVEMTYQRDGARERMHSMAFLYATTEVGQLGKQGDIEVVDVPATRVLSMGLRGSDTEESSDRARAGLRAWLADHPEWLECGATRVMGWNSPMVRDADRFREVQIPIRAATPKEATESASQPKRD